MRRACPPTPIPMRSQSKGEEATCQQFEELHHVRRKSRTDPPLAMHPNIGHA